MAKTNSKGRGHTPGSIYRIALENFVTFRQVEVFPGASLNLIIGPNGTGKSTFVCAIVLGLGGKTSVIGRAKTIGEYVKSGHQQATIEIELYQDEGQPNITVTRNFNCDNNTVWSIDKKPAKMKDITDLMDRLSIRVDNLCQLLPQDRVQDFAKMNPQELLKSTQIAVSGQEAVDLLAELIENKTSHRKLNGKLLQLSAQLMEQETINANMQTEINSMQERKKIEKEIVLSEKKKLWLEYEGLKNRVDEISKDRDAAQKFVKEHRVKMQPLERQIEMGKREVTKMEESKSAMSKEISILLRKIRDMKEASQSQNGNIRELEAELAAKILQHENKHRDIEQAKATLSRMQNDLNNLLQQYGDESMVKQEMIKLQQPITKTNTSIDQLKQKKVQMQYELDSKITPLVRLAENRLRSLNNVASKRLETLQSVNEHAYRAVLWLRQNEDMFQGNVYEPMLLMLNFKDPSLAKYLENTVALRDLVAFTFEDSDDMNLFLKKVRSEMGLKLVNAVCSQPSSVAYQPPIPISQLRSIGFYTYLLDTVTGPEAIIRYLCKQYSIHRIPIGNEKTYNHSQDVPPQINLFFSENHRFSVRVSEYSGAKSTSTNEIRSAKLMVNTMDQETLIKVQNELEELMELEKHGKSKIQNLNENLGKLEDSMNLLLSKRKKFNESLEQIKTISARIRMQQNKVAALENEANIDIETEKLKCRSEVAACVLQQVKSQVKVMEFFKACTNRSLNGSVLTEKLKVLRTEVIDLQRNLRVLKDGANNAEVTLENIVRQLTSMKNTAKEKLEEAKQSTGNLLPHEKGFPLAKEFTKLPNDLTTIQEHIDVLLVKINCMGNGDNQIIIDFKTREQTILKLKKDVASLSVQCAKLAAKMTDLRDRWLPSLEDQIEKINRKFGEMFAQLGCAGEVQISKPNGDEEYDFYGISILVRFRSEEQLQVLSSHTQSGGERALSTALYLMALQQLSKVPFRCVDEVNQGMDPINERKMFQLLVKITSTTDNSQYFLLTPKLLPNLKLTPLVHVHTIQNGSKIMKYTKWNFAQFIKQANLNNSSMDLGSDDDD